MIRPKIDIPVVSKKSAGVFEYGFRTLFLAVILAVIFRFCYVDYADPYKCSALQNQGRWLDPSKRWNSQDDFKNWQPPGCIMHKYKKEDIQKCFRGSASLNSAMVFIGDSTIRQVFWAVARKLNLDKAEEDMAYILDKGHKHDDHEFIFGGTKIRFIWDPWLNSSSLDQELHNFKANPSQHIGDNSAGLILAGAPGLWYARHGGENAFKAFRDSIEKLMPYMDHSKDGKSEKTSVSTKYPSPNFLLLAPVQVPRYQLLSKSRAETITPYKIDQMNDFLQQLSAHSEADILWSYSAMTVDGVKEYEDNGLHVVDNVAARKADVILNLRCNVKSAKDGYPFNRTCCSNYHNRNVFQSLLILLGFVVFPTLSFTPSIRQRFNVGRIFPSIKALRALGVLALVLCLCFYADRTQVFEKVQKQFQVSGFRWSCLAVLIIGLLTIRGTATKPFPAKFSEDGFFSRDQTDEWKGWMQAVILVYHYTHGSQTLWIYIIIRLLIAAYLFNTGYGHTLYFLRKEDYSLERAATVLLRLNLLSCVLPIMMRTEYQLYYFAPLVTFWFLVIYFTLKIGRKHNTNVVFFFNKLILSAALATAFTKTPGVLEYVSIVLKYTCAIHLDAKEWRFRISTDMYIVYFGMAFAALLHRSTRPPTPRLKLDNLMCLTKSTSSKFFAIFAALMVIPLFWAAARKASSKYEYNSWQPYISCFPVLAYIALRNSHSILRNYHSTAFAWLGKISLETYVLQFHIWLAGDSTGLLRTGIFGSRIDAMILTPLFLWVSWHVADVTQQITDWFVGGSTMQDGRIDYKSPYLLPRSGPAASPSANGKQRAGTPSKNLRFDFGGGRVQKRASWALVKMGGSLRLRLGVLALVIWLINVLYR